MKKSYLNKSLSRLSLLLIFTLSLIFMACAQAPGPQTKAIEKPEIQRGKAEASWEQKWEDLIKAAKREGKLSIIATMNQTARDEIIKRFNEKFGITVDIVTGRGNELVAKVMAERKAGLYLVDIYTEGPDEPLRVLKPTGALEILDKLIFRPDVADDNLWKVPLFFDKDHTLAGGFEAVLPPIIINTDLVSPDEIKSFNDLLAPKWAGKIVQEDPTVGGAGQSTTIGAAKFMGLDFIKSLLKQKPAINRDKRVGVEWLARGKYPIGFALDFKVLAEFIDNGAPIAEIVPQEGADLMVSGLFLVFTNAPHPNAAKLFANWILTKEGQSFYTKASGFGSRRKDVSNEWLFPSRRMNPGMKYTVWEESTYMGIRQQLKEQIIETYKPYMR